MKIPVPVKPEPWKPYHAVLPSGVTADMREFPNLDTEAFTQIFAAEGLINADHSAMIIASYKKLAVATTVVLVNLMMDK